MAVTFLTSTLRDECVSCSNFMKNILVVENSKEQIQLLTLILNRIGFNILVETNLVSILDTIDTKNIVAVILDIMLPEISGDILIKKIRYIYPTIPIIMITALKTVDMERICLSTGANYYLVKPVLLEDMEQIFKQYL